MYLVQLHVITQEKEKWIENPHSEEKSKVYLLQKISHGKNEGLGERNTKVYFLGERKNVITIYIDFNRLTPEQPC